MACGPLGRVTVYSVSGCPHCVRAKSWIKEAGLPVQEVDVNLHKDLWARVKELTGRSTVPQIFFNSIHVGDYNDLNNLSTGELERLVHLVKEDPVPSDGPPVPGEHHLEGTENHEGADKLSEALLNMMLRVCSDHISADGKSVDYKAISCNPGFERYCELTVQLQSMELLSLSHEQKLAFFINIYNALVIHGNLRLGSPKNIWQRYRFFNYVSYLIGGEVFTLQDIENGVLRGNRKGVAQLLKPFSKSDPRLKVALPDAEPLIHFALNCGARGCPPIKIYTAKDINGQLRSAAEAFLDNDDGCQVDALKGEVKLSRIFKWYRVDFGDTDEKLLKWILNHMCESPKKTTLQSLLTVANVNVSYMPYD